MNLNLLSILASVTMATVVAIQASAENHSDAPNAIPSKYTSADIVSAAKCGQFETVRTLLLLKGIDPSHDNNKAIKKAARNGYLETVKLLLLDDPVNPFAS